MCHLGKSESVKYIVSWNCYTPADDTVELSAQTPEHFITRCKSRERKHYAMRLGYRTRNRRRQVRTPHTLLPCALMTSHRLYTNKYAAYMTWLSMIRQEGRCTIRRRKRVESKVAATIYCTLSIADICHDANLEFSSVYNSRLCAINVQNHNKLNSSKRLMKCY